MFASKCHWRQCRPSKGPWFGKGLIETHLQSSIVNQNMTSLQSECRRGLLFTTVAIRIKSSFSSVQGVETEQFSKLRCYLELLPQLGLEQNKRPRCLCERKEGESFCLKEAQWYKTAFQLCGGFIYFLLFVSVLLVYCLNHRWVNVYSIRKHTYKGITSVLKYPHIGGKITEIHPLSWGWSIVWAGTGS